MSSSDSQEMMRESLMKDLRNMMKELLDERLQQEEEKKKLKENHENEIKQTTATPAARRTLLYDEIPELISPLTAVKKSAVRASKTRLDEHEITPHLDTTAGSSSQNSLDVNIALQKAMSKPPIFNGTTNEDLRTWWRQMKNYVSAFPSEVGSRVIKSYMRGSAATWLESQERDLQRELTTEELAEGLTKEYGCENISSAALHKIESLSMGISAGCDTVSGYNTEFSKLYNQLSANHQINAVRSYTKGIAPRYLKYMLYGDTNFETLAEAKAAVIQAVAKHDQLELAYANHNQHKKGGNRNPKSYQRGSGTYQNKRANDGKKTNKDNNRKWEDTNPYRYALSSLADTTLDDEDNYDDNSNEGETEGRDHQVAAIASVGKQGKADDKRGGKLSKEEMDKLRKEGRCFNCREKGHRSFECKKEMASPMKPLNG
jgi:hypothetical protein